MKGRKDMELEKGKILVLDDDDREFAIVDKIDYNNERYVYLTTIEGETELKVCKIEEEDGEIILEDVEDFEEIKKILSNLDK